MKKLIVLVALVLLSAPAYAAISGSSHDFSGDAWNTTGEICIVCHTPHNADTTATNAPLWNHALSTWSGSYTLYDNTTATQDSTPAQPTGVSLLCLSCHDGTVNLDAFGGAAGSAGALTGSTNLGVDLSDDHPVGIVYDDALATADGELATPSTDLPANNVGLFGGRVECSSCHDVHNSFSNPSLLVTSNAASALCLTCHNK